MARARLFVSVAVFRLHRSQVIGAECIALTDAEFPGGTSIQQHRAERTPGCSLALLAEANLMVMVSASESTVHGPAAPNRRLHAYE
jgi:hypothetical protein